MRYILFLCLSGLVYTQPLMAQCDLKQYTQIFAEAQDLQEQGLLIEAKNKFDASKIYACNEIQRSRSDDAIDSLFGQMDFLRRSEKVYREKAESESKRYLAMRDTAILERQRADVLIEAFSLKQEGDIAFRNKDLTDSYNFYQKSIDKLKELPGYEISSIEWALQEQLQEKMDEVILLKERYKEHLALITEGDQYATDNVQFIKSYEPYLKAWNLGIDTQQILLRLKDLELNHAQMIKYNNVIKGYPYYKFLYYSAETNMILGNVGVAYDKIKEIIKYRPQNIDFIESKQLNEYAKSINRKSINPTEIYIASSYFLGNKVNRSKSPGFVFGIRLLPDKKFNYNLEIQYREIEHASTDLTSKLRQLEVTPLLAEHRILRHVNRNWGNSRFELRVMAGLTFGDMNLSISQLKLPGFISPPFLTAKLTKNNTYEFNSDLDINFKYKLVYDSIIEPIAGNINSRSKYINGFLGLNAFYVPFPKVQVFTLYASMAYKVRIPPFTGNTFPIKNEFLSHLYSNYNLSDNDLDILELNYDTSDAPTEFVVDQYDPNWFSHIDLRIGLLFRI